MRDGVPANRDCATLKPHDLALKNDHCAAGRCGHCSKGRTPAVLSCEETNATKILRQKNVLSLSPPMPQSSSSTSPSNFRSCSTIPFPHEASTWFQSGGNANHPNATPLNSYVGAAVCLELKARARAMPAISSANSDARMTRPMVRKPCIWSLICTSVTGTPLSSSLRA